MNDRIILVGQAPSQHGDPERPLIGGATGTRLMELTGLTLAQYVRVFHRTNVFPIWMGKNGKGDLFPMKEAWARADALSHGWKGRRVVFVGAAVARAFCAEQIPFFGWTWLPKREFTASVIPHPSPVNRFWNRPENVEIVREFFRAALEKTDQKVG